MQPRTDIDSKRQMMRSITAQSNSADAEVLVVALRFALDSAEWFLVGPKYRGCRVDRAPDTAMAALMLSVAEQLRSTPFAPGTSRPKAWKKQVGRMMGLANVLRGDASRPAQADLVQHFAKVYVGDAARELRARRFLDLGDGAAAGPSTTRRACAVPPPGFPLV
jgi:hypothetical protein